MVRLVATAAAVLVVSGFAGPALADFSACDSAYHATDPHDQISGYTLCIAKGGVPASDLGGAFNNRGIAYLRLGEVDKAFDDFSQSIVYDPHFAIAFVNRGEIYAQRGDLAKAEADFDMAIKLPANRSKAEIFVMRGRVRAKRGDCAGALSDAAQALKRDHKSESAAELQAQLQKSCPASSPG